MARILYAASVMGHINAFHKSYVDALRSAGHELTVMANGEGADINIPFEKKIFSRKNRVCRKMIKKAVEDGRFDAIIVNTTLAAYHIRLAIGRGFCGRVVNVVHGYLFSMKKRGVKGNLMLLAERLLRRRTDSVIVMNGEDLEIANKYKLARGEVDFIKGMGAVCRSADREREKMREALGVDGRFVIVFVGELSKRKNQEYLISSLSDLKKRIPNVHLLLVGDGDERARLGQLAKSTGVASDVTFLGRRSDPCDVIRASDVYVSASKSEGLPFNIIEALGCGVPIVASDVKGQSDLISGGCGVLFDLSDLDSFLEAVESFYDGRRTVDGEAMMRRYNEYSFDAVFSDTYAKICRAAGLGEK